MPSLSPTLQPRVLAGVLVSALALLAGCGSSSSSTPQRSAGTHGDPQSIFEDELRVHENPSGVLDELRRLGIDRLRLYVPWRSIAPSPDSRTAPAPFNAADPAAYPAVAWASYDTIVREATKRGIPIDLTIGEPVPNWAMGRGAPSNPFNSWKPSAGAFGAFVQAVSKRYDGHYTPPGAASPLPRIDFWAIWNEPNYGPGLSPQAIPHTTVEVSPRVYRGLLDAAWKALQATGHGGDTILIGETAPRGITVGDAPGDFQGMVPLRFIRALYCVDTNLHPLTGAAAGARGCPVDAAGSKDFPARNPALFQAAGFADHPYPQGGIPPNVQTTAEPDYADLAAIGNLESTLDRALAAYGSTRRLPIYSTEFGYQTDPPEKIAHTTSPVIAALYLNWSEYITWRNPRLHSYDQYLLSDPPGANAAGGFATGLEFATHTPKATYDAYRMPLYLPQSTEAKGQAVEVWGAVRPAAFARTDTGAPQHVEIQLGSGTGSFKTLQRVTIADPHGYFDTSAVFPHSGLVRLAWRYPHGSVIYSRTATIAVR